MIKIPQNNQFNVTNGAEIKPNIVFTKNVDFDEEGYIKLSPPMPSLLDDDTTDFGIVSDAYNYSNYNYILPTRLKIWDLDLSDLSFTKDTSGLSTTRETRICGYDSDPLLNTSSDIYELSDAATFTWVQRNTSSIDYMTEFASRQTWVGDSINEIEQYSTSNLSSSPVSTTSTGPTLQFPNYLSTTGIAYSNYRIGVGTSHDTGGNAYFFTWDGASASANTGTPVDAPIIIDVIAYKNSWSILTSRGQLLYFNGAGWDILGNFPPYFFGVNWINALNYSESHGRIMSVDNDIIYINIGSLLDSSEDNSGILQGFYSGVWCYDPQVGLYHRYSLSHSKLVRESLTPISGLFTRTAHGLETGDRVLDVGEPAKTYFAIKITANTFKLADSYDLAILGTPTSVYVNNTDTLLWIERTDWGQLIYQNDANGVCLKIDNNLTKNSGYSPFFVSSEIFNTSLVSKEKFCLLADGFDNIGAVEYYKMKSIEVEDIWQSIIVKHKPLSEGDKIIVKYKIEDGPKKNSVGDAGDTTPDTYATWVDADTFTFDDSVFDATGWEVGDEVEFMAGAGAGQTAHITEISEAAGVWTVSVDESIRGATAGAKSTLAFSRYKKLATITKESSGFKGQSIIKLGKVSKWLQVKLEMRGNRITLEELIINNKVHNPVL